MPAHHSSKLSYGTQNSPTPTSEVLQPFKLPLRPASRANMNKLSSIKMNSTHPQSPPPHINEIFIVCDRITLASGQDIGSRHRVRQLPVRFLCSPRSGDADWCTGKVLNSLIQRQYDPWHNQIVNFDFVLVILIPMLRSDSAVRKKTFISGNIISSMIFIRTN